MTSNNYKDALAFNMATSQEVEKICAKFFRKYSLNYFAYLKFLKDGSILRVSNHLEWTKDYFSKELYDECNFYVTHWQSVPQGQSRKFLWVSQSETKIHMAWKFNGIGNGFSIYRREADALETCSFGTYLENYKANDLYVKYGKEFENFICYFKRKAAHLLEIKNRAHLIVPTKKIFLDKVPDVNSFLNQQQIKSFLSSLKKP